MYNFSYNFNSHVLNVYVDMEHQRLIVAYRGRCVMPYPHGGSKVIDVSEFACIHIHSVCPCVCAFGCTCVYHHMFDSADLTHANECCQHG